MVHHMGLKIISFGLVALFILSSEPLFANDQSFNLRVSTEPEYLIDQSQEEGPYKLGFHQQITLAQSFIPTITPLTKVEVKIEKPRRTVYDIILSVRASLDGPDMTAYSIAAEDVPYYTNWIEFDVPDVDLIKGNTYYIVLRSLTSSEYPYRWHFDYNMSGDIYSDGKMYRYFSPSATWEPVETSSDYVDASFRTYSYHSYVNLECEGYLNWTDIQPGEENLIGFFVVRNNGTPYSRLNWKIQNWPGWGTWQFSVTEQTGLKPEDGDTRVNVIVNAPQSNVPDEYLGKITIINKDNVNDTEIIQARLVTPKGKSILNSNHPLITNIFHLITRYRNALFQKNLFSNII